MTATQLAHLEVHMTVVDHPTSRRRWNGDPMASEDASEALNAAVNEFQCVVRNLGFDIVRTGYGVTASEAEPDSHSPSAASSAHLGR
jgi:hypothetical protein